MPFFAFLICIGCLVAAILQLDHYLPLLPERMAIRFDLDGKPNGWMGKDGFAIYYFCLLSFVMGVFILVGLLVAKLPPRLFNIPHRDYWMAPERRAESLRYLKEFHLWAGAFGGIFIVAMMEMIFKINLSPSPMLDNRVFYTALGFFSFSVLAGVLLAYWRFRKPDKAA